MRMISISFLYWLATINVFLYADFLNFMKYWYVFFYKSYKSKEALHSSSNLWHVYLLLVYLEFKLVSALLYLSIVSLYLVDRVMNNFSVWSFFLSRQTQKAQTEQEDQVSYVTPGGHLGSACS